MKKNGFKKEIDNLKGFIHDDSSRFNLNISNMLSKMIQKKNRRSKG